MTKATKLGRKEKRLAERKLARESVDLYLHAIETAPAANAQAAE